MSLPRALSRSACQPQIRDPDSLAAKRREPAHGKTRHESATRGDESRKADGGVGDAEVDLNQGDSGFFLRVRVKVSLPGMERAKGEALVKAGHETCPYSKATRGNVDVVTTLV